MQTPHPRREAIARAVAALAALWMCPAHAAELVVAQPGACAVADELTFRVERALGQSLATAADARCTVYIERAASGFKARLELASPDLPEGTRQRHFTAPTCEELTDALVVGVVLAIGARLREAAHPGSATPSSQASTTTPAPATIEQASRDSARPALAPASLMESSARVAWQTRAGLVLDVGTLPTPAWGAMLGVSVDRNVLEARLVGTYLWPREVSVNTFMPGSGAELAVAAAALLGCGPRLVTWETLALGACVGVEFGWMWGHGTGLSVNADRGTRWIAGRADAGLRWGLGPRWLGLDAMLGAIVPMRRSAFVISNAGEAVSVHRPEVVEFRASLGFVAEFD